MPLPSEPLRVVVAQQQIEKYYTAFPNSKSRAVAGTGSKGGLVRQDFYNEIVRLRCTHQYKATVSLMTEVKCSPGCEDGWPESLQTATEILESEQIRSAPQAEPSADYDDNPVSASARDILEEIAVRSSSRARRAAGPAVFANSWATTYEENHLRSDRD